jgi:DnaA family protein
VSGVAQQLPLDLGPAPDPSFERFVPDGNEVLLAHVRALTPGEPPTLLWGPSGAGKTHLLHALAQQAQAAGAVVAAFTGLTPAPWALPVTAQWVLMDDVHRLDESQQHAAFAVFIEAVGQGATVVATSACPPVDLALRDDLRTRLGWGATFALNPLPDAALRRLLQQEAHRRGLRLPPELLDYVLLRFERHPGSLMRLLEQLDHTALRLQRAPTVPLLRQMLNDESHSV